MADNSEFVRQKLKTSEFRDVKLEKTIISGMLKHSSVMRRCSREMSQDWFSSDRCKWIFNEIVKFYDAQGVAIDTNAFTVLLENRASAERKPYLQLWESIIKLKKKNKISFSLAAISRLRKLYDARLLEFAMAKTIANLTKSVKGGGDELIEKAKQDFLDIVPKLQVRDVQVNISDPISLYSDFKKRHIEIQKDPSLLRAIPTGIEELDKLFGGLRPSEFGLITAGTGVGKSIMLLDFAFNCYLGHGDILYITIEMPENQLRERFYCRLSGIEYNNFRSYKLDENHWKHIDKKIKKLDDHDYKFGIMDLPQSCDVKVLKDEIEEYLKREKNREPKLILIDYMNIMKGGFDWSKQLEISVEIKQLARYFKIATWSANQLQGSKHDKQDVKIGDMGFAKNIADNVDIGIGLGLTDATEEEEIFRVSFTKTRDFKGKGFMLHGDRGRMTFTKSLAPKKEEKNFKKREQIGGKIKV